MGALTHLAVGGSYAKAASAATRSRRRERSKLRTAVSSGPNTTGSLSAPPSDPPPFRFLMLRIRLLRDVCIKNAPIIAASPNRRQRSRVLAARTAIAAAASKPADGLERSACEPIAARACLEAGGTRRT